MMGSMREIGAAFVLGILLMMSFGLGAVMLGPIVAAGPEKGITHNGDVNCGGFGDEPGVESTDALFILRYVAGFDSHSNWPREVCPHVGDRIVPY